MRRLCLLLVVLGVLVVAATPGPLSASPSCPASCGEAMDWCWSNYGGYPIDRIEYRRTRNGARRGVLRFEPRQVFLIMRLRL